MRPGSPVLVARNDDNATIICDCKQGWWVSLTHSHRSLVAQAMSPLNECASDVEQRARSPHPSTEGQYTVSRFLIRALFTCSFPSPFREPKRSSRNFFLTAAWRCKFFRYNLPETFHRPEVAMVFSPLFLNYFLYSTISNNSTLCCIIPPSYSNLILI